MQTGHDKQATENREPANEMDKEDPTQGIPLWLLPFTVNLEDLEAHALAHFLWKRELRFGRSDSSKVETQKRKQSVRCSLLQKTRRDLFQDQKSEVAWQQQSTKSSVKDANLATITDSLSWCKFSPLSGIRVKPKLHRRRTRIYKVLVAVAEAQIFSFVQFIGIWQVLWRMVMESLNNCTSSIGNKRNCRASCTSSERRDVSRIEIWIRMISSGRILWSAVAVSEMSKTSWQTGNLNVNEDLGNPFWTCFVRGRIWEEYILIAEIEELNSWMHQK